MYLMQAVSFHGGFVSAIIVNTVSCMSPLLSPCKTLSLCDALFVGSAQLVYWTVTSQCSSITSSHVGIC